MERVQLIFLGHYVHLERTAHVLKKYLPHKVYFIKDTRDILLKSEQNGAEAADLREQTRKKLEKYLPAWVAENSKIIATDFMDFDDVLTKLTRIMAEEKKNNNDVLISLQGATIVPSIAATMAAAITNSKAVWLAPSEVNIVGDKNKFITVPVGTGELVEVEIPLVPDLPQDSCSAVINYVNKNGGAVRGKLKTFVDAIGLENLGANITKETSGVVKLSKYLNNLRSKGLVETQKIGRKQFEIKLTKKGILTAKILDALK